MEVGNPATRCWRHVFDCACQPAVFLQDVEVTEPGLVQDIVQDRLVTEDSDLIGTLPGGDRPYEVVYAPHTGCVVEPDHPGVAERRKCVVKFRVGRVKISTEKVTLIVV